MFRRLLIEEWTTVFTLVAFVTALSVYVTVFYRTLRMGRAQADHLAQLPFEKDETSSQPADHE